MKKIIIIHRNNYNDKQELTLEEFKAKFRNELTSAINTYTHHNQQKDMLQLWKLSNLNKDYRAEFYQDLRWNFNNNAATPYYIDRIEY
ncbi:hypothetical protein J6O48_09575 [bacterium]|nr:hypothetical protein [bacterium]